MPVVMIMEWEDITLQQYDQVRKIVDWEGKVPPGGLYHVAASDGKNLRVVDVWESAEQFQHFVDQRLMPGVQKAGIQTQPRVEVYPTHAIFTPGYQPLATGGTRATDTTSAQV